MFLAGFGFCAGQESVDVFAVADDHQQRDEGGGGKSVVDDRRCLEVIGSGRD
jgi:hypothetical protein